MNDFWIIEWTRIIEWTIMDILLMYVANHLSLTRNIMYFTRMQRLVFFFCIQWFYSWWMVLCPKIIWPWSDPMIRAVSLFPAFASQDDFYETMIEEEEEPAIWSREGQTGQTMDRISRASVIQTQDPGSRIFILLFWGMRTLVQNGPVKMMINQESTIPQSS